MLLACVPLEYNVHHQNIKYYLIRTITNVVFFLKWGQSERKLRCQTWQTKLIKVLSYGYT